MNKIRETGSSIGNEGSEEGREREVRKGGYEGGEFNER